MSVFRNVVPVIWRQSEQIQLSPMDAYTAFADTDRFSRLRGDGLLTIEEVKLDDGEVVFFKRYWVNESYMQNPYNGAKGFMIKQRISLHDRIVDRLSK